MDQATVKDIFRQKLNQILTPDLLSDSDIVDVTLLVGYRMYSQKCDDEGAIRILSEATDNQQIVNALVTYFNQFTKEQKKIAEEAKEKEQAKNQQNIKKQDINKSKGKIPPKPKAKAENKNEGETEGAINIPPVQKKPKLQDGQQAAQGGQQEGQPPVVSIATQLINEGKVKCKYFPFCKNQECQYFHPTEKCQFFPRCKFGQACMCVHQACKYGQNCTRSNCFYDHPFKKKSDNPMVEFMKMAMGQMKSKRPIRKRKPTEDAAQIEKANEKPVEQQQK